MKTVKVNDLLIVRSASVGIGLNIQQCEKYLLL